MTLTTQQRQALIKVVERVPGLACQGKLGDFLEKYLVAEAMARKILKFGAGTESGTVHQSLDLRLIQQAARSLSLGTSPEALRALFLGGVGIRGTKSARQLRNGYLHSLNQQDRDEIESRFLELASLLTSFMEATIGSIKH